jgi:hypothetical protein
MMRTTTIGVELLFLMGKRWTHATMRSTGNRS